MASETDNLPSYLPAFVDQPRVMEMLDKSIPAGIDGIVWSVGRNAIEAVGLSAPMGAVCSIGRRGATDLPAQVIGFEGTTTLLASLDGSDGIAPGDRVRLLTTSANIRVGSELIGRVIDAAGQPIDGGPVPASVSKAPLDAAPVSAMQRPPIDSVLVTGVRAIDSMLTLGLGQRIGIFAGSGVGKSTLLGMMARGTNADVVVVGLVGERGREVQEYLQREMDETTRKKCVTVVATSDQPALRRVQAAMTCTAIAEYFRDQGKNVLLMMDSVTRFAMAQREIGLAAGEAPTTRGYPPSVFSMLPRLVERSGTAPTGSITGIYTVLVEGDDNNEPISDALRGLLDGHIVLSRDIAHRGLYPAIDILSSLSRLQTHLVPPDHLQSTTRLRNLLSVYKENEDLITIGAYQRGSNPAVDQAITMREPIEQFVSQPAREVTTWSDTVSRLKAVSVQAAAVPQAGGIQANGTQANGPQAAAQHTGAQRQPTQNPATQNTATQNNAAPNAAVLPGGQS